MYQLKVFIGKLKEMFYCSLWESQILYTINTPNTVLLCNAVKTTIARVLLVIIRIWAMVALKSQITPPRKEGEVRKKIFVLYSSEELSWVECHMYQIKKVHSSF